MLENIVLGCVKANRESQKELYQQYYGFAMGICMRYAKNEMQAEEIVNDSFLKVYKNIASFKIMHQNIAASFMSWMKQILIHTAIDSYRKNERNKTSELIEENHHDIIDNANSAIDKMFYAEIIAMVQNLSPTYRTIFNLFVLEGYKHEEIATLLNISVGTSKSNLAKARANIQKMLKKQNITLYEERRAI